MKTDDLISLLATGVAPIDQHLLARKFWIALLTGATGACLLMAALLGFRNDLAEISAKPAFWAKVALPTCLLAGSNWMLTRLARAGVRPGNSSWLIAAPVVIVWLAAAYVLVNEPANFRLPLILGKTWRVCPLLITLLSLPTLITMFGALRALTPTRLTLVGAVCGLSAGSTATLAYCLHCPEMEIPFWAVWYILGMAVPTIVGALLGPRLLRW